MPNRIFTTFEYHAKTPSGKYLRASKVNKYSDDDEWEITVFDEHFQPIREFSGWDEVRVLAFMELYEDTIAP